MRKVALVFVLAVFVPSLLLAWLAVRSLRDQQFVLERQQSLLYQSVTDSLVNQITEQLAEQQRDFNTQVETILDGINPRTLAATFDDRIRRSWTLAEVGFCVTVSGNLLAPTAPFARPEARTFYLESCAFLGNLEPAEVYAATNASPNKVGFIYNNLRNSSQQNAEPSSPYSQKAVVDNNNNYSQALNNQPGVNDNLGNPYNFGVNNSSSRAQNRKVNPVQSAQSAPSPTLNDLAREEQAWSKLVPSQAEFAQLVGDSRDGVVARFLQNKLKLMFWHRAERDPQLIFGVQVDLTRLTERLRGLINVDPALQEDICVALLDDSARPMAISQPGFSAVWKRPFVATEVGEALPHWEVAAYLLDPAKLTQSAQTLRLTLGLIIGVLVLAIGVGSWLIVTDLNRQLELARQKTDFVSNVSHELKTPLTSIRMFSELLAEERVADPARQRSYLGIITAEAARLTRLINNVLDFSRMERGEKKYHFQECDLISVVRECAESYRPHLENNGFTLNCALPDRRLPVRGDCDSLAQIVVNLLSNAEKYSKDRKEISVQAGERDGPLLCAEVRILDRGLGVPGGSEEKIFEKFYRAHDSLSSGIQGSGLGLTLARQIARAHGGDVFYETREGGGSCFCLRLPLAQTG
jgi:signal transduction histidine kinase